jgi:hypothetical protein
MAADRLSIIGRPSPSGPWLGVARDADGAFVLAFVEPDLERWSSVPASRLDLMLAVLGYFSEPAESPPADLEATQADVAELSRWLADSEPDPERRQLLEEAVDAIDDGLAGEAVAGALMRAARPLTAGEIEREDPLALLLERYPG